METFICYYLNKSCYNKDETKALTLGPFGQVLTKILSGAQRFRPNQSNEEITVYRGGKFDKDVIKQFFDLNGKSGVRLKLSGYSSTSMDEKVALGFMQRGLTNNLGPVLFQIQIGKESYGRYFKLDQDQYSLHLNEQEILLEDGAPY